MGPLDVADRSLCAVNDEVEGKTVEDRNVHDRDPSSLSLNDFVDGDVDHPPKAMLFATVVDDMNISCRHYGNKEGAGSSLEENVGSQTHTEKGESLNGSNDVSLATDVGEEGKTTLTFSERFDNFRKKVSERRNASAASLASEATATKAAKEEQAKQPTAVEKEMEKLQEADFDSMRASKISVTVIKEESEAYGFSLVQAQEENKDCVKIDKLVEDGLLHHSPLKVGDTLRTMNNKKVANCEKAMEDLVGTEGPVTLGFETPEGNPSVVQAFCRKPSKESLVGIGFHILEHGDHQLLQISHLAAHGLLSDSALSQGDIVLAINDVPCAEKSPDEAATLILDSASTVTIVALNPRLANQQNSAFTTRAQRWLRGAKRAGIAIGGGTMVGVGLIFIPTLPPPFGEVLIVGGVSVLGTEFEAPKRLVRSTRDSFERIVGRNCSDSDPTQGDEEAASEETPVPNDEDEVDDNNPQFVSSSDIDDAQLEAAVASTLSSHSTDRTEAKRTMKDRVKSFGRNYVLPFLDQVVGDHAEENLVETEVSRAPVADGSIPNSELSPDVVAGNLSMAKPTSENAKGNMLECTSDVAPDNYAEFVGDDSHS